MFHFIWIYKIFYLFRPDRLTMDILSIKYDPIVLQFYTSFLQCSTEFYYSSTVN